MELQIQLPEEMPEKRKDSKTGNFEKT